MSIRTTVRASPYFFIQNVATSLFGAMEFKWDNTIYILKSMETKFDPN